MRKPLLNVNSAACLPACLPASSSCRPGIIYISFRISVKLERFFPPLCLSNVSVDILPSVTFYPEGITLCDTSTKSRINLWICGTRCGGERSHSESTLSRFPAKYPRGSAGFVKYAWLHIFHPFLYIPFPNTSGSSIFICCCSCALVFPSFTLTRSSQSLLSPENHEIRRSALVFSPLVWRIVLWW